MHSKSRKAFKISKIKETKTLPGQISYNTPVKTFAAAAEADSLAGIFQLLQQATGVNFSHYKHSTLKRRIQRRLDLLQIKSLKSYERHLKNNPEELQELYRDFLINVTSFFREPASFGILKRTVFPALLKKRPKGSPVRIWVPACSTGEEVYSIAICLLESMKNHPYPVQIFATDINEASLEKARAGIYPSEIAKQISPERLKKYFVRQGIFYQVTKKVRDMCIFARQDVTQDPPFSKMDLISCRNLFIYFDAVFQKKVSSLFHYALKPSGFLILGSSETVNGFSSHFHLVNKKFKIYTKKTLPLTPLPAANTALSWGKIILEPERPHNGRAHHDLQSEADSLILQRHSPAGVIISEDMTVLQFRGPTAHYLEHSPGQASLNLLKMVPENMAMELRMTLREVKKKGTPVRRENVRVRLHRDSRKIHFEMIPLKCGPSGEHTFLVLFGGTASRPETPKGSLTNKKKTSLIQTNDNQARDLSQELTATREYLQSVTEEHEATVEELRTANEETLSANEELQSTNEELETAKEELQAANEELTTLNEELQKRNLELKRNVLKLRESRDFSEAIIDNVRKPLIVLNSSFRILRINPAFSQSFQVTRDKIEGRSLFELGQGEWNHPALVNLLEHDLTAVNQVRDFQLEINLTGLGPRILLINACRIVQTKQSAKTATRLMLLSIEDVTEKTLVEMKLRQSEERFRHLVSGVKDYAIFMLDPTGHIVTWNAGAEKIKKYKESEIVGKHFSVFYPAEAREKKIPDWELEEATKNGTFLDEGWRYRKDGSKFWASVVITALKNEKGEVLGFTKVTRDMTERRQAEEALRRANDELEERVAERTKELIRINEELHEANQVKSEFASTVSHELRTPLSAIKDGIEIVLNGLSGPVAEEQAQVLRIAASNVDRLGRLINSILDYQKLEANQVTYQMGLHDLNQLIQDCVTPFLTVAQKKGLTLLAELPEKTTKVHCDKDKIIQVMTNLVNNAIKFSDQGDITVTLEKADEVVRVNVRDEGVGIHEEDRPKLFKSFSQLTNHKGRKTGSSGLGLVISKKIIDAHGGEIGFESTPDKGSTFFFTLPLASS